MAQFPLSGRAGELDTDSGGRRGLLIPLQPYVR
jgi:hypothetical protein